MVIRRILFVLAVFLVVVGVSQVIFATWWLNWFRPAIESERAYLWGLPALLFGLFLLVAVLERTIRLRAFFAILAIVSIVGGAVVLANPQLVHDAYGTLIFDRSLGFQRWVVRGAGLFRAIAGVLLIYALLAPPRERAAPRREPTIEP